MKYYVKKCLALLIAIALIGSGISVQAADVTSNLQNEGMENSSPEQNEDVMENEENVTIDETGKEDESALPQDEAEVTEEETEKTIEDEQKVEVVDELEKDKNEEPEEIQQRVNYIYVESPYLETPGTERIVVSWGDGTENIEKMTLDVQIENGTVEKWEQKKSVDNLYLFEKSFSASEIAGVCKVTGLSIVSGETTKTFTMSELGAEAVFGVNKEYSGIDQLQPLEGEQVAGNSGVEAVVATINEDGTVEEQESIAEALDKASEDTLASTPSVMSLVNEETVNSGNTRATGDIVVALDPGHDSTHAGAHQSGLAEEVLTLKIANYCKAELETYQGVRVYMTRTTAACPYPGTGSSGADIAKRAAAAASAGAKIFVSFHLNSSTSSAAKGAEIIIPNNNWKPSVGSAGKALADSIMTELTKLGLTKRTIYSKDTTVNEKYADGSLSDYFSVQIYNKQYGVPGIIIEHAFMTNSSDVNNFLSTETGLKKLGIADATGIAKYLGLSKGEWVQDSKGWKYKTGGRYVTNQLMTISGKTYYFDEQGYRVNGLYCINSKWYYFNADGSMLVKSWKEVNGKTYFFRATGDAAIGLCYVGSARYYFNADGSMLVKSWKEVDGKTYFFRATGDAAIGLCYVGSDRYYFNADGSMLVKSWKEVDGKTYFFRATGDAAIGLCYVGSARYYFNADGSMLMKSWKEVDGETYFFRATGDAAIGLCYVGSDQYYFNADGSMLTGALKEIDGKKYYFGKDGKAVIGLREIDGKKYYFNADGSVLKKSWKEVDGKTYFFRVTGDAAIGLCYVGSDRYYFNADGSMLVKSWKEVDGKTYFFRATGDAAIGLCYVGSDRYYFNTDGSMLTGALKEIDGKKYYFGKDGKAVIGLCEIDGKKYYFNADGSMLKKSWKEVDGETYFFRATGDAAIGLCYVGSDRYYFNADGSMLVKSWKEVDGETYFFRATGDAAIGLCYVGSSQYYFDSSGVMQTGWKQINGKWYFFAGDGILTLGPQDLPIDSENTYLIEGQSGVTVEQMVRYYKSSGKTYPAQALGIGGASTIEQFCQIYYEEAHAENIKVEVAFAQAMLETGWLQFTGDVKIEQFNFAGLGATGNGQPGNSFIDVRTGVRAQIQHLKAYASTKPLNQECVDVRFKYVTRGCAIYVEWLGIPDNPYGKGWATAEQYGARIRKIIDGIKTM